jgi:thiamine phosphate synthase YjbQ (UPF0047 family)
MIRSAIRFEVETSRPTEMVPITSQVQDAVTRLSILDGVCSCA